MSALNKLESIEINDELHLQHEELNDSTLVDAYWSMINSNKEKFIDKVILEVGSKIGLISVFCIQAGAKKVYAIEENEKIAELSKQVFNDNNVADKVEVLVDSIEHIILEEKVDVIISHWMGYYLIDGELLPKVIAARKFLKKDGIIIPESASLYCALCTYKPACHEWESINGVQLKTITKLYRQELSHLPYREKLNENNIISNIKHLKFFDMKTIQTEDIDVMNMKEVYVATKEENADGITMWWEVELLNGFKLSNSPYTSETHWKQTVIFFVTLQEVEVGTPICIELNFQKSDNRRYNIRMEICEPNSINHEIPCNCTSLKCVIIKKYLQREPNELELQELSDD